MCRPAFPDCPPIRSSLAPSTTRTSPASRQFGAQSSNPQFQNPFAIDPKINYTIIHGHNSIKVGYEFQAINTEIDDFNPTYGNDNYGGGFSSGASNANIGAYTGSSDAGIKEAAYLTDFLVGARNNYQLNNFVIVNYHQMMNFMYVQDDLKVSNKLTVNAGLRYELVTPQWVSGNHLANFIPRRIPRHRPPTWESQAELCAGRPGGSIQPGTGQHADKPISLRVLVSPTD